MRLYIVYMVLLLHCVYHTDCVSPTEPPPNYTDVLNDSYILVHTLKGDVYLVNRYTGTVKWSKLWEPALYATYNGGPILIADPIEGRLYEYSSATSDDVLTHLNHSIMGYVRRSPAYYKNHLSFGTKTDHWLLIDLQSGEIVRSSSSNYVHQCPNQLPTSTDSESTKAAFIPETSIGLGQTKYNLLFRDPITGMPRLNITFTTFASHTEPDLQSFDLQHIATTHPRLVTFKGNTLLWDLPLSSPIVGLYAVWNPNVMTEPTDCEVNSSLDLANSWSNTMSSNDWLVTSTESDRPEDSTDTISRLLPTTHSHTMSCDTSKPPPTVTLPHILKRIAFTTYALDFRSEVSLTPTTLKAQLENKFNDTLDFSLSLLLDSSPSAPVYALPCVAETSLPLRTIRRVPKELLLEGPEPPADRTDGHISNLSDWSRGLFGLYELPWTQLNLWIAINCVPLWARVSRWHQITDESKRWPVIVPPIPLNTAMRDGVDSRGFIVPKNSTAMLLFLGLPLGTVIILMSAAIAVFTAIFFRESLIQGYRKWDNVEKSRPRPTHRPTEVESTSFLPVYFDMPNSDGWAGCSAQEAGQPEAIRFNLNHVIGHGANGTMVFAGTFGKHQTAVKRIVRQPQLEKHWRREHAILLHLQHPNLVRCFWTGSSANFHYLVMQRCAMSLTDLLQSGSPNAFSRWGLTPTCTIHQFSLAVACLHRNRIVHRDLKPSNILIVSDDSESRVVVGDFGLSRPLPMGRHELTNSFQPGHLMSVGVRNVVANASVQCGSTVTYNDPDTTKPIALLEIPSGDQTSLGIAYGTLGWMAPEMCSVDTDHLTYAIDVFSCGLLAFHVLTGGGHPFDDFHSNVSSDQPSGAKDDSLTSASVSSTKSCSGSIESTSQSAAVRLNRHHARQLAIVQGRPPALGSLVDGSLDISIGFLGRQLIHSMLSHEPNKRPTADEIVAHPLFWSPGKVMRFISELSDLLDTREDESKGSKLCSSNHGGSLSYPPEYRFVPQRRALLDEIESSCDLVFREHWFRRLESEVVDDLLATRGYQDTSLMDLLRAIRNKRHHFWHLKEHIRGLLGHTQDGMAFYWSQRFPSLIPLLYGLSRCYLTGLSAMAEFLPPPEVGRVPEKSDVMCHWWRTVQLGDTPDCATGEQNENQISGLLTSHQKYIHFPNHSKHERLVNGSWRRGDIVIAQSNSPQPTKVPDGSDANDPSESTVGIRSERRRRPNQAKKIRPPKRKIKQRDVLSTPASQQTSLLTHANDTTS